MGRGNGSRQGVRRVLFVCVENSCRSQMAEAFARMIGGDRVEAFSAGSRPSGRVDPAAIETMAEVGCDLATHRSKPVAELPYREFDAVVSMGCGDACPSVAARHRETWEIPDPKGMSPARFREVREAIRGRVEALLAALEDAGG